MSIARSCLHQMAGWLPTYDKIHMFDVRLSNGEKYRESKRYTAGTRAVIADLPWGKLGMTICYDMRFPGSLQTVGASRRRLS